MLTLSRMREMLITPGSLPGYLREPSTLQRGLRIVVPYTTPDAARASLRVAATFGAGEVDLVAVQVIHYLAPLEPDGRTEFLREQLQRIAADSHIPVTPSIVLTHDDKACLVRVLPPDSLLLVGARRWFSREARLARRLQRLGYDVVVVKI